jgi:predicted nucleotidyltransferase component of viral defense system
VKRQPPPRNVRSIDDRLRNRAAADGVEQRRLRHRLAVIIVADALQAALNSDEKLVIKGGTAMMLRFGIPHSRMSKDLDAMLRGEISSFLDRLREQGRTARSGWTFTAGRESTIDVPGLLVKPWRAEIKLSYNGGSFSTVKLEISPEEGDALGGHDEVTADDLKELGIDETTIKAPLMTVPYQVAQKLHACTERVPGRRNDRARDLVDLAVLTPLALEQRQQVRAACLQIFDLRAAHTWPPTLAAEDHWSNLYSAAADGMNGVAPPTLEEALIEIRYLIDEVDKAV